MQNRGIFIGAIFAAAMALAPAISHAEPVVLKTKDGAFEIRGELIGFDGTMLTVRSNLGVVNIPLDQVTCTGPGCPGGGDAATAEAGDSAEISIRIAPGVPPTMLPALIDAYGQEDGVSIAAETPLGPWTISSPAGSFKLVATDDATAKVQIGEADGSTTGSTAFRKTIALDPIVAVTGPANRPSALTLNQIAAIFSGATTNWSALNVRGGLIVPVLPARDAKIDATLKGQVLTAGADIAASVGRTENVPGFVLSNSGSIALMRGSSKGALRSTAIGGECGLTASADEFGVKSGQYPLVQKVILTADDGELPPALTPFFAFLDSASAQDAISASGLVGLAITRAGPDRQADWIASAAKLAEFLGGGGGAAAALQELVQTTGGASRLSITLRYAFQPRQRATTARGDFDRLAEAIEQGVYKGNEILFIGFSDVGAAVTAGRAESDRAANRVLADFLSAHPALASRDDVRFTAIGFGGIAPLLCSGSAAERAVNQRVEIWVKPL